MASPHPTRAHRLRTLVRSSVVIAVCAAAINPLTPALAEPVNPDDALAEAQSRVESGASAVSGLAGDISRSETKINELELNIGALRESVNKALVDLHDAQANAEQARQAVTAARERLDDTQTEIDAAQDVLNEISRSAYRNGAKNGAVTEAAGADSAEDALDRRTFLRVNAEEQRTAIEELDQLRTRQANEESQLREARNLAEQREAAAEQARTDTEAQIATTNAELAEISAERDSLLADRDAAQAELNRSRQSAEELHSQRQEYEDYLAAEEQRKAAEEEAAAAATERREAEEAAERATQRAAETTGKTTAAEGATRSPAEGRETGDHTETTGSGVTTAPTTAAEPVTDEADAAAEAERALLEAEQAVEREETVRQLRDTAVTAASVATAALVAEQTAEHNTLDNPYPDDEGSTDVPIAAVQSPLAAEAAPAATGGPETATSETSSTDGSSGSVGSATEDSTGTVDPAAPEVPLDPLNTFETVSEQARESVTGTREEQIEMVIARAKSQIGQPYAWGGGDANGPTRGIRDGGVADTFGDYNKVGFDCSGLMVYAFAGVGLALPHYTGYQYHHGTKVDPSNMERGDLIFYGPDAEHHVAIYLGGGKMLEAPQSGSSVQISDVRWSGMSPSAVRLI